MSEAEIAFKKLKREAVKAQTQASQSINLPPMKKMQNDWRFWVGIIFGISALSSLLTAVGNNAGAAEQIIV
mgnify:CR=1 FL=1